MNRSIKIRIPIQVVEVVDGVDGLATHLRMLVYELAIGEGDDLDEVVGFFARALACAESIGTSYLASVKIEQRNLARF